MSQYIGKTISLVSNKGLRYVGLLDNINAQDSTVALKLVRLLGTEGRMAQAGNPNLEVPAGNDVYEYVVFRGSDVKDLTVLDTPIEEVKPEVKQQQYYPQPAPAPQQSQQHQQHQQSHAPPPLQLSAPSTTKPTRPQPQQPQPVARPTPSQPSAARQSPPQLQPQAAPVAPASRDVGEFDFQSANARFTREQPPLATSAEQPNYNKQSSFFDTISSSADERNSMRWAEEKTLNLDTFGETQVDGRRNRGRGGFRGGRGGNRGNNRGGSWRGRGRGSRGNSEPKPEWA
jgi:protein LSM14